MKQKLLAILLAVSMTISGVPIIAVGTEEGKTKVEPIEAIETITNTMTETSEAEAEIVENGICGSNATYTLDSEGTLVISGSGEVKENTFEGRDIKKVIIEEGITTIGDCAFWECSGLTSVEIPESVTSIGDYTFSFCENLTSIEIPENVTSIGCGVFQECRSLTSIKIPESVTSIGESAFYYCDNLTSIEIPESVTSIGACAFYLCENLTSIEIPENVTSIEGYTFCGCENLTNIEIPESVISIGEAAFYGCKNLTSIEMPESVTSIKKYAFYLCENITSINMPESITRIGEYTFYGCENLTSIEIPESVTSIGEAAFYGCENITSIEIPESVKNIEKDAFANCLKLTIYCVENSTAHTYAVENSILYVFGKISDTSIITFDANEGTNLSHATKAVTNGNAIGELPTTTREGYIFKGWYTEATGGTKVTADTIINENMTLYAQWEQTPVNSVPDIPESPKEEQPGNTEEENETEIPGNTEEQNKPQTPQIQAITDAVITLFQTNCNYNGKEQSPAIISVQVAGKTLVAGTDYTVSYQNNKNIGTATVTITGKGNYTGTATATFAIVAKKGTTFTVGANKYKIIGDSTVSFTGLKNNKTKKVTIPKTIKIGGESFKVTAIADNALKNKKATSVTIGENVTTIGKNVFFGCKKLGSITIKSTKLKKIGKNAFKGIKAKAKIKVPSKKLKAYKKLLKGKGQGKKVKITK